MARIKRYDESSQSWVYADIAIQEGSGGAAEWDAIQNKPSTFPPSTHTHAQSDVTGLSTALNGKQDTISDLETIRSGATLGATALQSVPDTYRTAAEQDEIHDSTKQDALTLGANVSFDADGKLCSSNYILLEYDGTGIVKNADSYYNSSEIFEMMNVEGDSWKSNVLLYESEYGNVYQLCYYYYLENYISWFYVTGETIDFIGLNNSTIATWYVPILSLPTGGKEGQVLVSDGDESVGWAYKQDTISDLETIRSGAALGATALQPDTTNGFLIRITYDTTTSSEIQAILDAGNTPYIIYSGNTYYYQDISYDNYYRFVSITPGSRSTNDPPIVKRIYKVKTNESGGWGVGTITLYSTTHKPTASDIGALPDTTVIPTVPTDDINANTAARHSHDNKTVLDDISAEDIVTWNAKQDALTLGANMGFDNDGKLYSQGIIWLNYDNTGICKTWSPRTYYTFSELYEYISFGTKNNRDVKIYYRTWGDVMNLLVMSTTEIWFECYDNGYDYVLKIKSDDTCELSTTVFATQTSVSAKQDKLIAGDGITIAEDGKTISSNGGGGSAAWEDITDKPDTFTPSAHEHTVSDITDFPSIPSTAADIGAAAADHNHSGVYQPAGSYATADHNHDGTYQPAGNYAASDHNHSGVYQPAGSYAAADHSHTAAEVGALPSTTTALKNPQKITFTGASSATYDGSSAVTVNIPTQTSVTVTPVVTEGTLIATINGVQIFAPSIELYDGTVV